MGNVPEKMWIKIDVDGTISFSEPDRWCNDDDPPPSALWGQVAGPAGALGAFHVFLTPNIPLRVGDDFTHAEFIGEVEAGPIAVSRNGGGVACSVIQGSETIDMAGQLRISGSQTITITGIDPLQLHASSTFFVPAPGEAVAFTVSSELSLARQGRTWYWQAGDTQPTPAGVRQVRIVCIGNVLEVDVCVPVPVSWTSRRPNHAAFRVSS